MAITPTPRYALKKYTAGGDPHPTRVEFNTMIDAIEDNAGMFGQGATGARPAAGKAGRWYWDQTVSRMYYDDGVAWQDQNPNGGGGAGAAITPGAAAAEGVAARAARADHTHALALATAAVDGAMPKTDKAKLDAATAAATASTVMLRDTSGRVSVGTPTLTDHSTTKAYVDGQVTAVGDAAADYTDAAILAAPNATTTTAGKMSAADKTKLNGAQAGNVPDVLVYRSATGEAGFNKIQLATQTNANDAARKDYVDAADALKLNTADNRAAVAAGNAQASALPSTYATGVTVSQTTTGGGWPGDFCTVLTVRHGADRTFQTVAHKTTGKTYTRVETTGNTWTAFTETAVV